MAASQEFTRFVIEQMAGFGPVDARRMFGGVGLFRDGLMFALITGEDGLFLKVDAATQKHFDDEALAPFTYGRKVGERRVMSYRRAPERCLDDSDEMTAWANFAWQAALRAARLKTKARTKRA